jgi:dihydrofolate reductase
MKEETMSQLVMSISMSLDGYVAGPDPAPDQPLGAGGEQLHEWVIGARSWRESHGKEGGTEGPDADLVAEWIARSGATIMGREMFGGGPGPWGDEPWRGWWGDDPPFRHPVFVLTHHERDPLTLGATTFTFVTEGIEAALDQAREAAGDKDVALGGGADVAQQYLAAGLLDELDIHLVPVLLGGGRPLFGTVGDAAPAMSLERVLESPTGVTHLRYRLSPSAA